MCTVPIHCAGGRMWSIRPPCLCVCWPESIVRRLPVVISVSRHLSAKVALLFGSPWSALKSPITQLSLCCIVALCSSSHAGSTMSNVHCLFGMYTEMIDICLAMPSISSVVMRMRLFSIVRCDMYLSRFMSYTSATPPATYLALCLGIPIVLLMSKPFELRYPLSVFVSLVWCLVSDIVIACMSPSLIISVIRCAFLDGVSP